MAELSADRKELIFRALDAIQGRGPELTRFSDEHAEEYEMQLAPDGTLVVLHVPFTKEFMLFSLEQGNTRKLVVKGNMHLRNVTWAPDDRALFAANSLATGAELVRVDLQGNARVLWTVNGSNVFLVGKASPDGRHIAIQTSAGNSNIWMAEDF
jgi:Tol biopolymer transport system component